MRKGLRRAPLAQDDLSDRKGAGDLEFVRGRVERIPERFDGPAGVFGEDFFGPNGFVRCPFSRFEPRQSGCALRSAACLGRIRRAGFAPGIDDEKKRQAA